MLPHLTECETLLWFGYSPYSNTSHSYKKSAAIYSYHDILKYSLFCKCQLWGPALLDANAECEMLFDSSAWKESICYCYRLVNVHYHSYNYLPWWMTPINKFFYTAIWVPLTIYDTHSVPYVPLMPHGAFTIFGNIMTHRWRVNIDWQKSWGVENSRKIRKWI